MSSLYERRLRRSRLLSKSAILLALRFFWVIIVIWCEFGVFFYTLSDCRWPEKAFQSTRSLSEVKPSRVLLIADARLRNPSISASSPWFAYDPTLAYLRKSWRVVSRLRPNVVMFLGDTLASGRHVTSEAEYDRYYHVFEATFPHDPSTQLYLIPGNNDIGLGDSSSFSKDARHLFEKRFGPLNQVVPISGHQLVLLNAPGLVEEDYRRHAQGLTYEHWAPLRGGPIEFVQSIFEQEDGHAKEPRVLLTHIPLSRPSSKSCGPLREKGSIRPGAGQGYQTMLGKQTTEFLLGTLQPSIVFSADNRDYCEVSHEMPDSNLRFDSQIDSVREITVKSFSPSRHIHRPGFQLLSLVPPSSSSTGPTFAEVPCHLPDTNRVFNSIYVPCFILTALVLLYVNATPARYRKHFSNLSSGSLMRHGRLSPPPEPESAIWATRTPLKSRMQTSPTAPLPLSRIPSAKFIPSYRATPVSTPRGSPLLSPITLFPSGDEGDVEEDPISLSHYSLRRDVHHGGGWQDINVRERDTALDRLHAHPRSSTAPVPYFLPPPLSRRERARWTFSWSFVFWGRRRRMTIGLPDWNTWRCLLSLSTTSQASHRKQRGLVWRLAGDCVSVALPAVIAWAVIDWLAF